MTFPDYKILETDFGPMISHSKKSVYDVMLSQKNGADLFAICVIHGLNTVQVQLALDYIAEHGPALEPDLEVILQKRAERQAYYEGIANEIQEKINQLPMTPERKAFHELIEKNRRLRGENGNANHSE